MLKYFTLSAIITIIACQGKFTGGTGMQVPEYEVKYLPLGGAASQSRAEVSGLAWHGDWLILLAQYPDRFNSSIFFIDKQNLQMSLSQEIADTLYPQPLAIKGLDEFEKLPDYQGLEAICFNRDTFYLTIEMNAGDSCYALLVSGQISPSDTTIRIDGGKRQRVKPQADLENFSDEAITVWRNKIYTFYEANGLSAPRAHAFDAQLQELPPLSMAHLDYRLTDATSVNNAGRFWVINYYWPGDEHKFGKVDDPLFNKYGKGKTHSLKKSVERLVELEFTDYGVRLRDRPPLLLSLDQEPDSRNWEGIARWGQEGLLIVTDEHPGTILGYVAFK